MTPTVDPVILDPTGKGVILGPDGTPAAAVSDAKDRLARRSAEQAILSMNRRQIRDVLILGKRTGHDPARGRSIARLSKKAKSLSARRAKNAVAKQSRKANR